MSRLEDLSCVCAEIISGISIRKANNTLWSIIQRLVLGAAIYFIWRERNFRLFRNMERSNDAVFDNIVDTVRLKLLGLNIKRSVKSDTAAAIWRLPIKDVGKEWVSMGPREWNDEIEDSRQDFSIELVLITWSELGAGLGSANCKGSHSPPVLFSSMLVWLKGGFWDRLKPLSKLEDLSCVCGYKYYKFLGTKKVLLRRQTSITKANNTLWSIIQRLVLGAAVYFIRHERNFRLFRSLERSVDAMIDNIVDTVRLRLMGLDIKRFVEFDKAAAIWNLPIKDFGKKWDSMGTFRSSNSFGIVDISIGTTSSFFRPYACDHPMVITTSDWVGYHHGGPEINTCMGITFMSMHVLCVELVRYGSAAYCFLGYGVLGNWGSRFFGKGLGFFSRGSANYSLGFSYFRVAGTGFWKCNTIYIIDKASSWFEIVLIDDGTMLLLARAFLYTRLVLRFFYGIPGSLLGTCSSLVRATIITLSDGRERLLLMSA
ncbi:hypothetical protein Tco_0600382 [Tanacetum coccineum]|uniref:Reverse transcriptase zinc-binding domain-containing protein n=1 Tax=Tanacetum coccineum TaxID=301880 RepID=A0ABQ4WBN7_9ASTR